MDRLLHRRTHTHIPTHTRTYTHTHSLSHTHTLSLSLTHTHMQTCAGEMKAVMEMERVIRSFAISSFEGKEMEFKLPEQDLTEDVMYPNDPVRKLTGFLQWVMAHIRMHHISHMNALSLQVISAQEPYE